MDLNNLIKIMASGNISVPLFLIQSYRELNLTALELIVLSYLINKGEQFNLKVFSADLNQTEKEVLEVINQLQEKDLLALKVRTKEKGLQEEYLDFTIFYQKLALILISYDKEESNVEPEIFTLFAKEWERPLSPLEKEIITRWLAVNYQPEIIIEALKETVYQGVKNLRYIDRLLLEWEQKGLKTVAAIKKAQEQGRTNPEKVEIPDYNWLAETE